MKTLRNTEAELSKSVAYAKKCVADDLRQLPERQKQIARHEIESAIFKYQSNIFASNDQSLLNYNSIFHPSQQPYYGLPSSPLFTPTNSSLIGNYIGSSQSQTENRAQSLNNTKEMIRKVLKAFYCSFKGILERSAIC